MKKLFLLVLCTLCFLIYPAALAVAQDDGDIKISVDGNYLSTEVSPQVIDGRTMVPVRLVAESLGAEVNWDEQTKTVIAVKGVNVVRITVNGGAKVLGEDVSLDVPAQVFGGRTMVPLRFISEAFGAAVSWDGETKTVNISTALKPGYKKVDITQENNVVGAFSLPDNWIPQKDDKSGITSYSNKNASSSNPAMIVLLSMKYPMSLSSTLNSNPSILSNILTNTLKELLPNATIDSSKQLDSYKDIIIYEYKITNHYDKFDVKVLCYTIIKDRTMYVTELVGTESSLSSNTSVYKEMLKSITETSK